MTGHGQAMCSRRLRLQQETSDGYTVYDGTNSSSDDRKRRRPGRSDTGTSWADSSMPANPATGNYIFRADFRPSCTKNSCGYERELGTINVNLIRTWVAHSVRAIARGCRSARRVTPTVFSARPDRVCHVRRDADVSMALNVGAPYIAGLLAAAGVPVLNVGPARQIVVGNLAHQYVANYDPAGRPFPGTSSTSLSASARL